MQVAFEGTATAVNGELVTLHVDHWYHGGTAETVEVRSDTDAVATLLGVDFKAGESYLVTATNGQVSLCGESAPSNPDLRTLYQQAFPS
jgi:Iap family predicted aminopeptidase